MEEDNKNVFSLLENKYFIKKSIKKRLLFFIFYLIVFLIFMYALFLSPPNKFITPKNITISRGMNLKDISEILKNEDIIRSRIFFEIFVILNKKENKISEGDYLFKNRMPVFGIVRQMVKENKNIIPIKITIPEGYTNLDIAETFSKKLINFNKENFLNQTEKIEGYLFPDTYFFFSYSNEEDVIKLMLNNFDKKIQNLEEEINNLAKNQEEIIIMASIIEKEAKGDNDRAIISGILWNRIKINMPLQVDAFMETYKKKGLPQNPICNPGLKAIQAAIYPINSAYLYYLHDKNGNIYYAKSFEEHRQNINKYLK
jgi:UPF0755 protein